MRRGLFIASAHAVVAIATLAGPALARDAKPATGTQLATDDSIIVTARRRTESVQDVPLVVNVIDSATIRNYGVRSLGDVARLTPGLTFDRGISLQDTRPSIRGLPGTRGRPPVGILLDGVDISTEALGNAGGGSLLNMSLLDLERIEVVKGPQSALYGRAAFAGAINYITRRPSKTLEVEARASYASFNTYSVGATVSGPLLGDKLGFRANVMHEKSDGDYANPVTGANLNSYRNTGGALALGYDNGEGFNLYGRVSYVENRASQSAIQNVSGFTNQTSRPLTSTPEGHAVAVGFAGKALTSTLVSFMPPRGELAFTGVTGLSIDPTTGLDFPGSKGNTTIATLNAVKDFGSFSFVYNGGYINQKENLTYDGDFYGVPYKTFSDGSAEPLNIFDVVNFENNLRIFSQEARFQNLDGGPLRWAVGGQFWFSDMKQQNQSLRAISGFPLNPTAGGVPTAASRAGSTLYTKSFKPISPNGRKTDSLSAYGLLEYDLMPALTIGAEARYISETVAVIRSDFVQAAFAPLPPTFVNPLQRASVKDDAFVPRFYINYKPTSDLLLYASAAKGYKPGGVSELDLASSLADSRFKAETLWNYEGGFKSSWADRQITLNGALFYMKWTNKQVSQLIEDPAAPSGFRASIINAGGAEVLGIDASLNIRPRALPGFSVDLAYTYLHTKYTDFSVASNSNFTVGEGTNCTIGKVGTGTVCFVTFNGNRLERAPEHQGVANFNYEIPVSADLQLLLGASLQYQGSRYLAADNRLLLPSYWNLDAVIGMTYRQFTLQGFATNLTNDKTVRNAQENFDLSTFGRSVNIYAPPRRSFGVRGSVKF